MSGVWSNQQNVIAENTLNKATKMKFCRVSELGEYINKGKGTGKATPLPAWRGS
jgi:hypothetical protein